MSDTALIIGAGIGGLSTAIRLAAAGWRVTILEQNENVGGKMGEFRQDGFRWDTGPSVITMRHVLADLFAAAGRRLEDYLTLLPVEPLTRYFYADGTMLDASSDPALMAERIAAIHPPDAAGYRRFLDYAADLHRITGPLFIYGEPPDWRSLSRVTPGDALRASPWRTMNAAVSGRVSSPHMRQLLNRFATYTGSDPYRASAALSVIADVELAGGVWYPQGGIYQIAQALARLAAELGVEIRRGCAVEGILVDGRRVTGVRTRDGQTLSSSLVIANVDVTTVYSRLLPEDAVPRARLARMQEAELSSSGFILLLGVEGEHAGLAHHNIFFSGDYRGEFEAIFQQGRPPSEPTLYLSITSKSDRGQAPPGHENWFILANVPALNSRYDWARQAEAYRRRVLARLGAFGYDVRDRIRTQHMLTPLDVQTHSGAWRGALYGMALNSPLAPFRRPHNRCPELDDLYFVGGTTHPGGGVPMVMLSAKVVADMVVKNA